jgi:putative ABC transport system ATP-binding protein
MNVAAGLDDPTGGEVYLGGHPLHRLDDDARTVLRRDQVGFVFQSFNLVPTLDVQENVLLPFVLAGRQVDAETDRWVTHIIGTLGLADRVGHRPSELSGGQQQRVAIARAIAARPQVIFADEPTGNLDSRSSREVLALLRTAAHEYGQTIAMVTHDPVAASYAERILVLADGTLVGDYPSMSPQQISDLLIGFETGAA